jgi:hypothetical protein
MDEATTHSMSNPTMAAQGERAQASRSQAARLLGRGGLYTVMVAIMLAPAIWNGFPFVFADTGGYLERPFEGTLELGRSALYGAFLAAGLPTFFWPNVAVQALLCVWIIGLVLRTLGRRGPRIFLITVAALCVCTSLPWYAGDLEPDIFLPIAVLAFYLLGFASSQLRAWEIAGLVAVIAFAIAAHMSIYAMLLLLFALCAVLWTLSRPLLLPRPALPLPAIALVLGTLLALGSNFLIGGSFAFTPGGSSFLFGRLLQDGFVKAYLEQNCPQASLSLCRYRDELPTSSDDWMWGHGSPLGKLGGWNGFVPEANRIIIAAIIQQPGAQALAVLKGTLRQLGTVGTGDGFGANDNQDVERVLKQRAPQTMPTFEATAQQRNAIDFHIINLLHVPLALGATVLLPVLIVLCWYRRSPITPLALMVFAALVANAFVCATFSGVGNRYQSRIAWIAVFAAALVCLDLAQDFAGWATKASRQRSSSWR